MSLRALRGEISSASFPCEQRDLHILEILQDFRKKRVMLPRFWFFLVHSFSPLKFDVGPQRDKHKKAKRLWEEVRPPHL